LGGVIDAGNGTASITVAGNNTVTGNNVTGKLSVAGTFNLGSGAHLAMQIGGTTAGGTSNGYDQIAATGAVSLSGDLQVHLLNTYTYNSADVFNLILNSGNTANTTLALSAINGQSFNADPSTVYTIDGQSFTLATVNADGGAVANDIALQAVAVPEPSTWAMMLGGAGMLVSYQRMRRSRKA
jgi:hypothetical protein